MGHRGKKEDYKVKVCGLGLYGDTFPNFKVRKGLDLQLSGRTFAQHEKGRVCLFPSTREGGRKEERREGGREGEKVPFYFFGMLLK